MLSLGVKPRWVLRFLVASLTIPASFGQKTDVVVLQNGDRLTGEIKKLELGLLSYKTDHEGTISIEWDKILRVTSKHSFQFELIEGEVYFGTLAPPTRDRHVRIITDDEPLEVEMIHVVRITPINKSFWDNVDGYVSLGYNFTKASEVTQLNASGWASYRRRQDYTKISGSAFFTEQKDLSTTQRWDIGIDYQRFFAQRWFGTSGLSWAENKELGYDLRTSLGLGVGRILIQSNTSRLSATVGLAANNETPVGVEPTSTTLEGVLSLEYGIFRYDTPKTNLSTGLSAFPNLSESGRVRVDFDTTLRHEIISDFFWDLTFYLNYDSDPPTAGAERTDLGIVTSFGYSF